MGRRCDGSDLWQRLPKNRSRPKVECSAGRTSRVDGYRPPGLSLERLSPSDLVNTSGRRIDITFPQMRQYTGVLAW